MARYREGKRGRQLAEQEKVSADILRLAQPRLVMGVENARATDPSTKPYICDSDIGWDELLDEGYDPDHSPLGPVYCRIIRRGNQKFYCSTCWVALHQILSGWGMKGLTHCDPKTKMAIAMIETLLD